MIRLQRAGGKKRYLTTRGRKRASLRVSNVRLVVNGVDAAGGRGFSVHDRRLTGKISLPFIPVLICILT